MSEMINPYIAGAPVTEASMFFGREDVFDWIERSLPGRYVDHILVIHGQRRVGKTSVLKQLPHRLPERYIPVFFDLQGRTHTTLERFLWWLAREITRVLKQDHQVVIPMPKGEDFTADPEYLEGIFLPSLKPHLSDQNLLLTFDEFDSLEEADIKQSLARPLIDYLRRLTGQEGLNFIFSIGSSGRKLENMQASYTEFFKTALYKEVSFLGREDTFGLITQPVHGVLEYARKAVSRIYQIASGHPYFTQLICHELFSLSQKTGETSIRQDDVETVLDDVIERGTVNLKFVWDEASDLEKWILSCLAHMEGKKDTRSLTKSLQQQRVRFTTQDLNSALLHLHEKDVLTEDNGFVIHLLNIWLQKNRPLERVREELIEVNPIASRYIEIGLEYKDIEQFDKAIESFQEALRVDPENILAQVNIGSVHLEAKSYAEAVTEYEKALSIDEEDVAARAGLCEAHIALGDQALTKGRDKDAIRSYQQVLSINAEHTDARQRMADIHKQNAEQAVTDGRFDEAVGAFKEALKFTPEDEALEARFAEVRDQHRSNIITDLMAKAKKEQSAKRWDQAITFLEEALELAPEDASLQEQLADIRQEQRQSQLESLREKAERQTKAERWDQAVTAFEEYLNLEPDDAQVAERLAEARQRQRQSQLETLVEQAGRQTKAERWVEALASWQAYLAMEPEDREVALAEMEKVKQGQKMSQAYTEAREAMSQKDYNRAVSLLKGIVVQDPTYKNVLHLLTQAVEMGRKQRRLWQRPRLWIAIGFPIIAVMIVLLIRSPIPNSVIAALTRPTTTPTFTLGLTTAPELTQTTTITPSPSQMPSSTSTPDLTATAQAHATSLALVTPSVTTEPTEAASLLRTIEQSSCISAAWSPDGSRLAAARHQFAVVWHTTSLQPLREMSGNMDQMNSVAWSPNGLKLASTSYQVVWIWDYSSGNMMNVLWGHGDYDVYSVAWSPDGLLLASGDDNGTVIIWEAAIGNRLHVLSHNGVINSVAWSPDSTKLASGGSNNIIMVWDATSGEHLYNLDHGINVNSVAWSPDGTQLASGGSDGMIRVWDASNGEELDQRLSHTHSSGVNSVAWSPDGTKLASGGNDTTVRVWDTTSWEVIHVLSGYEGAVNGVAWSPDGTQLVSSSEGSEGGLRVWNIP